MAAEDFRASAHQNWDKLVKIREYVAHLEKDYRKIKEEFDGIKHERNLLRLEIERDSMRYEDAAGEIIRN